MCWVFRKSHPRKFLNHFWNCIAVPGSVQPSRWLLNVQAFVFDGSTLARYSTCGRDRTLGDPWVIASLNECLLSRFPRKALAMFEGDPE